MKTFARRAAIAGITAVVAVGLTPAVSMAATTTEAHSLAIGVAAQGDQAAVMYDIVDLPTLPVVENYQGHEFTVSYRNDSNQPKTVSSQILVESPDYGPFLQPADVRLQLLNPATGHWHTVPLGAQTGTLYSTIPAAGRRLLPGRTVSRRYRLTVVAPAPGGTAWNAVILPRIVIYGAASQ